MHVSNYIKGKLTTLTSSLRLLDNNKQNQMQLFDVLKSYS